MVPPCSDRIPRVPPYLSYIQYLQWSFGYTAITLCGWLFQVILLNHQISYTGSSAFARHYLRNLGWFLFLRVLRWFSSPGSRQFTYVFSKWYCIKYSGFPHSDIAGSQFYCQLPNAFRRLTRPSSPIIAKASTWCTYSLDSIISKTFDLPAFNPFWLQSTHRWFLP